MKPYTFDTSYSIPLQRLRQILRCIHIPALPKVRIPLLPGFIILLELPYGINSSLGMSIIPSKVRVQELERSIGGWRLVAIGQQQEQAL